MLKQFLGVIIGFILGTMLGVGFIYVILTMWKGIVF